MLKKKLFAIAATLISVAVSSQFVSAEGLSLSVTSPDYYDDSLRQDITVDLKMFEDLAFTVQMSERENSDKTDLSGLSQAYARLDKLLPKNAGRLALTIGKAAPNWSPWRGNSIVLSGTAPGFDQVGLDYEKGIASYSKLLGKLSGNDRYLLSHRLSLRIGNLTGTVGEAAVVDGTTINDLTSIMPWPIYLTQWIRLRTGGVKNDKINDAVILQGIYKQPVPNGFLAAAELFIDDAPYINRKQPFEGGGQVRLELPIGSGSKFGKLSAQYVRINNYAYSYLTRDREFSQNGYPLGDPGGPDHDEARIEYTLPKALLTIDRIGVFQIRRGQGRLGDFWENKSVDYGMKNEFLSGVVETTKALYGYGSYELWDSFTMDYRLGGGPVGNLGHKTGKNTIRPYLAVDLKYAW